MKLKFARAPETLTRSRGLTSLGPKQMVPTRQKTRFTALIAMAFFGTAQPQAAAREGGTACTRIVTKLRELPAKRCGMFRTAMCRRNAGAPGIRGICRQDAGVATPHGDGTMAGAFTQSVMHALVRV